MTNKELIKDIMEQLKKLITSTLKKMLSFLLEKVEENEKKQLAESETKIKTLEEAIQSSHEENYHVFVEALKESEARILSYQSKPEKVQSLSSADIKRISDEIIKSLPTEEIIKLHNELSARNDNKVEHTVVKDIKEYQNEDLSESESNSAEKVEIKKIDVTISETSLEDKCDEENAIEELHEEDLESLQESYKNEASVEKIEVKDLEPLKTIEVIAPKKGSVRYNLVANNNVRKGQAICWVDGKSVKAPESGELVKRIEEGENVEVEGVIANIKYQVN